MDPELPESVTVPEFGDPHTVEGPVMVPFRKGGGITHVQGIVTVSGKCLSILFPTANWPCELSPHAQSMPFTLCANAKFFPVDI